MLRTTMRTGSALAILLAASGLAMAQVQVQVQTQPAPQNNQHALHVKSILGATVNLQSGTGIGTVHDIVLNDDGVVDYLVVSDNGKLVTVPWEAAKFNIERRTAVINISSEQFRQIPTYT